MAHSHRMRDFMQTNCGDALLRVPCTLASGVCLGERFESVSQVHPKVIVDMNLTLIDLTVVVVTVGGVCAAKYKVVSHHYLKMCAEVRTNAAIVAVAKI